MMLGGMEPKGSEKEKIGAATDAEVLARLEKLEKELQWHRWAIILLVLFIMYQQTIKK